MTGCGVFGVLLLSIVADIMAHQILICIVVLCVLFIDLAAAFSHHCTSKHHYSRHRWSIAQKPSDDRWISMKLMTTSSSSSLQAKADETSTVSATSSQIPCGENYSTLTLLEHMHLLDRNVHKRNNEGATMLDFFTNTLGFGVDPKSVDSLLSNEGVVFVNAGPSQLHLNDDSVYCQKIDELRASATSSTSSSGGSGEHVFEIGLRYNSLDELKKQLLKCSDFCSYDIASLSDGREIIRITDIYDRVFVARAVMHSSDDDNDGDNPTISSLCQQKIICQDNKDTESNLPPEIVQQYGIPTTQTACQGIDFLEFFVHVSNKDAGSIAEKIARFYDFFFDASTSVVNDGRSNIAIVGFGKIDNNGRAEQSLLFREVVVDDPQRYQVLHSEDLGTGHHIAIYVGNCDEDYQVAASNCVDGGLLWINPQFEDRVLDVESAMECKQFRFKNIIDIETGETLYKLEHEIRSISHPLFPGAN